MMIMMKMLLVMMLVCLIQSTASMLAWVACWMYQVTMGGSGITYYPAILLCMILTWLIN